MAKFPPIQYARTLPEVVRMPRARLDVRTGEEAIARGLMQLGGALDEIATNIYNRESAVEYSEQKRKYDERGFALFNSASGDIAFDPETNTYSGADVELWQKFEDDIEGELLTSKKPKVNALLGEHINNTIIDWKESFYKRSLTMAAKNTHAKFELEGGSALASGNLQEYYQQLNTRLALKDITQAEFDFKMKNAPNDSVLGQAYSMALDKNYIGADTKLSELSNPTDEQKEYRNKIASFARVQVKEAASEANKQLTDLLAKKQLTIPEIQLRRAVLDDNDYKAWTKIAMNPADKAGNIIQATELKSAAMDVWRGTTTRDELDNRIRNSLADENGINDEQYASVVSAADTQLKQSQAADIRRFSRDAANVILGQYSGLMQFDALGNLTGVNLAGLSGDEIEDTKYRMHFLSLYEQGLRDWIAENPTASGKEFYQYSLEEKMRYWNTSLERMKEIAKTQKLPHPKTRADFDALPSGITYVDPEGTPRTKP